MGFWADMNAQGQEILAAEREEKAAAKQAKKAEPKPKKSIRRPKVSDVGGACPNCGTSQWQPKRSVKGKTTGALLAGGWLGAAAAPKSQVKCVGCGKMFRRG
jgi:hypothetical protein